MAQWGRIDVLVNNAGYFILGAVEEVTDVQLRRQFDTNFFGLVNVTRAVLPVMRRQKAGRILQISSVVGLSAYPSLGAYAASKFAVEGISEALAAEVKPLGIHVTLVEPGAFRTASISGGNTQLGENRVSDYDESTDAIAEFFKGMEGKQPGDPAKAAQVMLDLVKNPAPPLRLLLGTDALEAAQQKVAALTADFAANESITVSTNFPDADGANR